MDGDEWSGKRGWSLKSFGNVNGSIKISSAQGSLRHTWRESIPKDQRSLGA